MAENKKLSRNDIIELVIYCLAGLLALWGLVYMCLGFAVNFISYKSDLVATNARIRAGTNGMGFLEQGIMILFIGVGVIGATLLIFAKSADRKFEKEQRRAAARFNRKNRFSANEEVVVDVESTPAE